MENLSLNVCSNSAVRSNAIPLLLVTTVDRSGHCKGDLLRLDRRTFCPVDRRKRSITSEDRVGSSIALVHIDPSGEKPMKVDKDFGIRFDFEKQMNTKIMEIPHPQISLFMQEICVFLE
uniref:Uncharacterized protein n=1 Tax=Meloidogyne javanica TaxID=6303 RepID=A0A915MEQ0_MELJA